MKAKSLLQLIQSNPLHSFHLLWCYLNVLRVLVHFSRVGYRMKINN